MYNFLEKKLNVYNFWKRNIYKTIFLIAIDFILISLSLIITILIASDNKLIYLNSSELYFVLINLLICIPIYFLNNQYKIISRFLGSKSAYKIILNNNIIIAIYFFICISLNLQIVPIKIILANFFISSFLITGIRFIFRDLLNNIFKTPFKNKLNVVIYGAGVAGSMLEKSIRISNKFTTLFFVDDNFLKWGKFINGVKIIPPSELKKNKYKIDRIFIAIPSVSQINFRKIIYFLQEINIPFLKVPTLEEITSNKMTIDSMKEVKIEDLLARDKINPHNDLLGPSINKKNIFITGAGGSIGAELSRKILFLAPSKIILLDNSEYNLHEIYEELKILNKKNKIKIIPILGNASDEELLTRLFNKHQIEIIFHAAAYKHVPLVESNPLEGLKNNYLSTKALCNAALISKVKKFVLISSDKAVRPTNVMGASKRLCELLVFIHEQDRKVKSLITCFSAVRFGNVLGSSGSVVPLFKKQIKQMGPISLTHPDVLRYFMTIEEACELVIQASALAKGGEVFLLDMGIPIKIKDLAEQMIKLSGLRIKDKQNPDGDIEIQITGLRPGEKLYEELLIDGNAQPTEHERIFIDKEFFIDYDRIKVEIKKLEKSINDCDTQKTLMHLSNIIPEWKFKNSLISNS